MLALNLGIKPTFCKGLYKACNLVGKVSNKIKRLRAVATRYDKRDDNGLAAIKLAEIRIWLRHNGSVT